MTDRESFNWHSHIVDNFFNLRFTQIPFRREFLIRLKQLTEWIYILILWITFSNALIKQIHINILSWRISEYIEFMKDTMMISVQFHIVDNFLNHTFGRLHRCLGWKSKLFKNPGGISIFKALNFKFSLQLSFLTLWITFSDCYASKPSILKDLLKTLDINNPACIKT